MTKTLQKTLQLLLITMTMAWSAATLGEIIVVNESAELHSNSVRLPSGNTGLLSLRSGGEPWRIDSRTALYVGHDTPAVSMTDFRAAVAATNRGFPRGIGSGTVLLVIWDPDSRVVKELVLEQ